MTRSLSPSQHILNICLALFVTALLAVPIAWWLSDAATYVLKVVRYGHLEFAPFEAVFVSEQQPTERLGGDFILHPDLFQRNEIGYAATVDGVEIAFFTNGNGITDKPCEASVDALSIRCEEIVYFGGDASAQYFIRLVGDLGISAEKASQFNKPHHQVDKAIAWLRNATFLLIPIGLLITIQLIGTRLLHKRNHELTRIQHLGLLLPWAMGLTVWTMVRAALESFFLA